jgi:outer membrane protein assembly factor BamB/SAM-dependent methyltransferase
MKGYPAIESWLRTLLATCLIAGTVSARQGDPVNQAKEILASTGVQGGIVVHLGCEDGKLTAALRAGESYTVQGLETDPAKVAEARNTIRSEGIYGPVSVERYSGSTLPYTDNLINLIVVQDAGDVTRDEIMRVLAPGGVAYVEQDGKWTKTIKPWPDNIDQWTHFLHDASNNAVADDSAVGPPRSLQWIAPPLWLRSHETPSGIESPVSAAGRIFYFFDEGLIGITDERLPDRWSLVCRDAFNGKLLWKRPLEAWGWREWSPQRWEGKDWTTLRGGRTDVPNENQRRIVVDGDRLYTTLSYRAPMSILDAATGRTLTTIEATRNACEILISDGMVVVYTRNEPEGTARRRGIRDTNGAALVAVDGRTAKVLWHEPIGQIRPLALAIDNGRIVYLSGKDLFARDLKSGRELWKVQPKHAKPKTLLTVDDTVVMQGGKFVAAYDATDGRLLWQKTVPPIGGGEGDDLFVVDGLVWRGIETVDDQGEPTRKSPNALAIGWDLRSGEEKKRVFVKNLRSPEHHHRCYRNKATRRYLIGSYEGAEFLDFQANNHSQNNWVRGACRYGMVPCNGMLYAPSDQCFCQPGAKLLGYAALTAGKDAPLKEVSDGKRLERGPAYGKIENRKSKIENEIGWPTFRHDPSRSGATSMGVAPNVSVAWKTQLKGALTPPVASGGKVFVAESDAHTLYALDASRGEILWHFTAGGRIDSPPTIRDGMVLFGSSDGHAYCLRASDGELAWRFLAAPADRCVAYFDQIESAWPVHGSVLVDNGTVYFTAGRSTYLDGGIRVYGLDPASGKIRHKCVLEGPNPFMEGGRDVAFFILGANSDVLVSEGGFIYMRQKKMTPDLKEIEVPVLSSKGAQDVGTHIFSTSGLLDGSWYNRTFWMYSKRWPGFQLANQAPKTGQLLVADDKKTYAVRAFYRRNVHSLMFFPGKEGYLLFADLNTNEPQIVGEPGWRKPLAWLPQSHIPRDGNPGLDEVRWGFGADKGIGYTRAEPPVWTHWIGVRIRAMVKAGQTLFVAGPPDVLDPKDPYAAFEGRKGAKVVAVSAEDGKTLSEMQIESPPVFDGLIAARGRLFMSLQDGSMVCLDSGRSGVAATQLQAKNPAASDN